MRTYLIIRVSLLAAALALAAAAALLLVSDRGQQQVLILTRDVPAGHRIAEADLQGKSIERGAVPPGAIADPGAAAGRYARGPLPAGQYLVSGNLGREAARSLAESSIELPSEWALVALPMEFEYALGGALTPGQAIDVYAVVKRSGGPAEMLAPGARLIDVRSNDGQSLALAPGPGTDPDEPIGSVLIALPRALLADIIARIEDSNFVLSSSTGAPD